jgi:hypothetical protein
VFTRDFPDDLGRLLQEVEHGPPFAFVRFGDGERAILEGTTMVIDKPHERWQSPLPILQQYLNQALTYEDDRYFVGVSCPCCDEQSHRWYMARRRLNNTSYANLFVNGNHERALPALKGLMPQCRIVSSAPHADWPAPRDLGTLADVAAYIEATAHDLLWQRRTVLVAAGPVGKAIIHTAYAKAKSLYGELDLMPTMIDIGSALDTVLHGVPTRAYHDMGHEHRQRICRWTPKP